MVVRIFTDNEVKFLGELALLEADNSTVLGSFRDSYPSNVTTDEQVIIKYRIIARSLARRATRGYCMGCGDMVYLLEGSTNCPSCR